MLQPISQLVVGVLRVIFLRGSPERVHYSQLRFYIALALAVILSAVAQHYFYADHVVFVILRVFAELTSFMLAIVLLTAKIARFRLTYMMLLLVMISIFNDSLLLLFSVLPLEQYVMEIGLFVGLVSLYGASSVMAWGLRKPLQSGAGVMALYVAAVVGLDLSFRFLYDIVATG